MIIRIFFGIFLLILSLKVFPQDCNGKSSELCPFAHVKFKTKALKHLGNKVLNALESLIVEGLNQKGDEISFYINNNKKCRDSKLIEGLSEEEKNKKFKKAGCQKIPLFENGVFKGSSGGENLSGSFSNIKLSNYRSRFIDISCTEQLNSELKKCKLIADIDMAFMGDIGVEYGKNKHKFENYKLDATDIKLELYATYDPEKAQFKIDEYKKGGNAFDLSNSKIKLLYSPSKEKADELAMKVGIKLYERLKREYIEGLHLRKERSIEFKRARSREKRRKQAEKKSTKNVPKPLKKPTSTKDVPRPLKKPKSNERDLFYIARFGDPEKGTMGYENSYNQFKAEMEEIFNNGHPINFDDYQNLSGFEKATIIKTHLKRLIKVANSGSNINDFIAESELEVLVEDKVCTNKITCAVLKIGEHLATKMLNGNEQFKESLGKGLTESLINGMADKFNQEYSKYSSFGEGRNYDLSVPCIQCLVDYPVLKKETEKLLEATPLLGIKYKEIPLPVLPSEKEFDKWLNTLSGRGINSNPCIVPGNKLELDSELKPARQFTGYYGTGPRILLEEMKQRMEKLIEELSFYEKYRKNSENDLIKLETMKKNLKIRIKRIEKIKNEILKNQERLTTEVGLRTSLDIVSAVSNGEDKKSTLNIFSNLSCNKSKECAEEELKQSNLGEHDGSIFLNINTVNAYMKKLYDLGVLDICYNTTGRTCAQALNDNKKCTEKKVKGENGAMVEPIHLVVLKSAPKIELDSKKNNIIGHGEIMYNNNPFIFLDKDIDIESRAKMVRCSENADRQCVSNISTVAKLWNLIGKNIDSDMESILLGLGVSLQSKEAITEKGLGFQGMDLTDVVIHKCSIEVKVKFIEK